MKFSIISQFQFFFMFFNQTGDISTLERTSLKLVDKFTYLGGSASLTEKDIDDFITNIKQKITAKNEKVPEVFSLSDNVLVYSERVVIPKKLQNRILRDFHTGHLGINRMKSLCILAEY